MTHDPTAHGGWHLTRRRWLAGLAALSLAGCASVGGGSDPLPSWNDGANKQAILKFVADVTREGASTFVPPAERVAVFDNDGTLWVEQPMYTQVMFVLDWVKANAAQHPEWRDNPVFKALASNDPQALHALPERELAGFVFTAQSGLSDEAYDAAARDWLARARHPKFNRPYTELVYQPQLELLATCAARASRPSSSRAVRWSSCGRGASASMASRLSR